MKNIEVILSNVRGLSSRGLMLAALLAVLARSGEICAQSSPIAHVPFDGNQSSQSLATALDDSLVAFIDKDDVIQLWDYLSNKPPTALASPENKEVSFVQISPNGQYIAAITEHAQLIVWKRNECESPENNTQPIRYDTLWSAPLFSSYAAKPTGVFSANSNCLLVSMGQHAVLFDSKDGTKVLESEQKETITALAISGDRKSIAIATDAGMLSLVDVATSQPQWKRAAETLNHDGSWFGKSPVDKLLFLGDDKVVGIARGCLMAFDTSDSRLLATTPQQLGPGIYSLAPVDHSNILTLAQKKLYSEANVEKHQVRLDVWQTATKATEFTRSGTAVIVSSSEPGEYKANSIHALDQGRAVLISSETALQIWAVQTALSHNWRQSSEPTTAPGRARELEVARLARQLSSATISSDTRSEVIKELGNMGRDAISVAPAMVKFAQQNSSNYRSVVECLHKMGADGIPFLSELIMFEERNSELAIFAIGSNPTNDPRAHLALLRVTDVARSGKLPRPKKSEDFVSIQLVLNAMDMMSVAEVPADKAVPMFVEFLTRPILIEQATPGIIQCLSRYHEEAAPSVPALHAILKECFNYDPNGRRSNAQYAAIVTLGQIGPRANAVLPDMIKLLDRKDTEPLHRILENSIRLITQGREE